MKIITKVFSIFLLWFLSHITNAAEWDIQKAYFLAIAAKCSYSSSKTEALSCLKTHPSYSKIKEDDIYLWHHKIRPDAYALISTPDALILAIRGTQPPVKPSLNVSFDWLNDAIVGAVENQGYHKGFYQSWRAIKTNLTQDPQAKRMLANLGTRPFYITGHSKGGSISTIATLDMSENHKEFGLAKKPDETYEFEPSRSLTAEMAKTHAADFVNLWRFEYKNDIVPRIPTKEAPQTPNSFIDQIDVYVSKIGFPAFASVGRLYYVNKNGEGKIIKVADESRLFDERTAELTAYLKEIKKHPKSFLPTDVIDKIKQRCVASFQLIDDHIVYWQWLALASKQKSNEVTVSDDQLDTLSSCCTKHSIKGITQCLAKEK